MGRPKRSRDIECTCLTCGKAFKKPEWQVTGKLYCSKPCYDESRRGRPRPDRRSEPTRKVCPTCGKAFEAGGRAGGNRNQTYCSHRCHKEGESTYPPPRQMSPEEVAWLAGIFDGEGSIAWPRKGIWHSARIAVANTNFELLERLLAVTGTGAINAHKRYSNPLHSPSAVWACNGDRARELLAIMLPWLIAKRHNARVVLQAIIELEGGPKRVLEPQFPRLAKLSGAFK